MSIYAAAVFTYGTVAAGAGTGHPSAYLAPYLPFLPVIVNVTAIALFALWCANRARER